MIVEWTASALSAARAVSVAKASEAGIDNEPSVALAKDGRRAN